MVGLDQAGRGCAWTEWVDVPNGARAVVDGLWLARVPAGLDGGWRIVADTAAHLLIHADTAGDLEVRVVGARRRFIDAHQKGRAWTVGVRLKAGALGVLSGLPATDFTDRGEDVRDVWGARAGDLVARAAGQDPYEALRALCTFVEARACEATPIDDRVAAFVEAVEAARGPVRVAAIARDVGAAGRTLRERAAAEIGLSPVAVLRVSRLHRALQQRLSGRSSTWSRVAFEAGYADQAHLNRDFRDLLGESPGRFLARA